MRVAISIAIAGLMNGTIPNQSADRPKYQNEMPFDGGADVDWSKVQGFIDNPDSMYQSIDCRMGGHPKRILQFGHWSIIRNVKVSSIAKGRCYASSLGCELQEAYYSGSASALSNRSEIDVSFVAYGIVSLPYPESPAPRILLSIYDGGPYLSMVSEAVSGDQHKIEIYSACKVGK